ncbi:MAG TPA: DUF3857 domain-containing protein [Candidatus Sulfotelmatobacter sp.]|nr:DUF3857 domain-containing protein [Candidatus Sulfotelmatobacter sp.]
MCLFLCAAALAQEPAAKPADSAPPSEKAAATKSEEKPALPFQIQLLETHVRFEANGDSRKEVHTIVKINDLAGARQFSRLGFDYNRAFQQVEIPLVKIIHANGGTSEILPSAITDAPNPAVQDFPAYHDVRVKSVRILGLQEGDTLEYRVITTTTKHPLAPDFWLEHTFDRTGQVLEEHYEIELLSERHPEIRINPATPPATEENVSSGANPRKFYRWVRTFRVTSGDNGAAESSPDSQATPDVSLSTLGWEFLSVRLDELLLPGSQPLSGMKTLAESTKEAGRLPEVAAEVQEQANSLTKESKTDLERLNAIYGFVSEQIRSVDLPLGATGFAVHPAVEVLKAGYGNAEDKYALFAALAAAVKLPTRAALTGFCDKKALPIPTKFGHLLISVHAAEKAFLLDPSLEVAPFGMIPPVPDKCAFVLNRGFFAMDSIGHEWMEIPHTLPFPAFQRVHVEASISAEGTLSAKLKYVTRGENELVLRMAFHQTPKERWKEVAGLLALSDGFRGTITNVTASDPMATKDPFTVEYEITQPKFVDWSKRPVRIPALLPQIALPDAPGKTEGKIELGTPLDVQTGLTLKLPEGTTVQTPAATSVARDYAAFSSKYDGHLNTVSVSRHINFVKREIPAERAADYNAFLRAVQNDQAQVIVLLPPETQQENRK